MSPYRVTLYLHDKDQRRQGMLFDRGVNAISLQQSWQTELRLVRAATVSEAPPPALAQHRDSPAPPQSVQSRRLGALAHRLGARRHDHSRRTPKVKGAGCELLALAAERRTRPCVRRHPGRTNVGRGDSSPRFSTAPDRPRPTASRPRLSRTHRAAASILPAAHHRSQPYETLRGTH